MASSNYIFTLHPTFTQGLVIGQLSILLLIYFILKYLFFDATASHEHTFQPAARKPVDLTEDADGLADCDGRDKLDGEESAEWFNMLLSQVVQTYRSKLRDDLSGPAGDEVARKHIEEYANRVRPTGFLDPIKIHSVSLGSSAPKLSSARLNHPPPTSSSKSLSKSKSRPDGAAPIPSPSTAHFNVTYTDSISVALSTACLLNYPFPGFARLPVSLVIELEIFESPIAITPPTPTHPSPTLTISLPPFPTPPQSPASSGMLLPLKEPSGEGRGFTIKLKTSSLLGSRAKLVDVPKVGELIEMQVRRLLAERGTFKIVLPGLGSVQQVQEELKKEKELEMQSFA